MRRVFALLAIAVVLGIAGWFVALYLEKAEYERRVANRVLEIFARARDATGATPEDARRFEVDGPDDPVFYPLARSAAVILPKVFDLYTQQVAALRLGRAALAVLEHRQQNGRWPAALPPGLPLDPYSGKPFVYEGTANGARLLTAAPRREDDDALHWEFVD